MSAVSYALQAEGTLHPTHRLDRLTSGLVLLAKTKEAARKAGRLGK